MNIEKLKQLVTYTLEALPEDAPVIGNAICSDDPTYDKKVEDEILQDLKDGNQWAWCTVKLTCSYNGIQESEYLGCCNYASEESFKQDGYFEDMKVETFNRLADRLQSLIDEIA